MPTGPVAAPARTALFGKLPAHGDFVRRGDAALARRLDDWLSGQIERLAAEDPAGFDERLAGLAPWCFALDEGLAGALCPSHDKVGRCFPLVAAIDVDAPDVAERIGAAIADATGHGHDADILHQALGRCAAIEADGPRRRGWWRPSAEEADAGVGGGFPVGRSFARLLEGDRCLP